ncbi:hypothetical protein ACFPER_11415 [Agromyces aurantiacus]|uniref:Uncharacterized protein n=1 Tax=Agromyces aurantiacus TaxID=165814 RepID=A0ABV9R7F2_9MICO|nr:hypothetical protein [Agromyces aurantiacus]MBM7504087.1 hypothetical protein [Agromyces aurantiacus]
MNVRRLVAPVAIGGLLVCAAAVALTVVGAFGIDLFAPTPTGVGAVGEAGGGGGTGVAKSASSTAAGITTQAAQWELVSDEERSEYMGREQVIAECMAAKGVEYRPAAPWLNQDAQPRGLSFEQSVIWLDAYYGETNDDWSVPASDWRRRGCLGVGEHAVAVARAAGTPLSAPLPEPDPEALTEEEELAWFWQVIETCLAEQGFGLDDDGTPGWWAAMYGDAGTGAAYRWEDAGCSGYATHVTGNDNMH